MREMSISHKLHPARRELSMRTEHSIKWCLTTNKRLTIGTSDIDGMYERLRLLIPDAKVTKQTDCVLVEKV